MAITQSVVVKGQVLDENGPVEFATVTVSDSAYGTVTDSVGKFELIWTGDRGLMLEISALGFERRNLSFSEIDSGGKAENLTIHLKRSNMFLDEIVISGTMKAMRKLQSPVPVEVYGARFFQANPAPSIFESMQNVNGVRPQLNCNVCNTGDIHINGLEGPYTMVLIDGMPIVSGLSTVYGLTGIPQSLIDRVELVKGPAGTLYGSEAVGGLINVITKEPSSAPLIYADVFSSSWRDLNADIGYKFSLKNDLHSMWGINYFNYQNPIDNNGDNFTDVTLQNRFSVFNKWSLNRQNDKKFSMAARYVYENRWGGEMNWSPEFRGGDKVYGESIYTNRWELFGVYTLPFEPKLDFYWSTNEHKHDSAYGTTDYKASQFVGFAQLVWQAANSLRHEMIAGIAFRYTNYDDNTPATQSADGIRNRPSLSFLPGIFVQDQYQINKRNKILAGIRIDQNNVHGMILSPRINYKWSSGNDKNIVRLSAGNGYRVANIFTEDHAALTGAREVIFRNTLNPETSWNVNLNYVRNIYTQTNAHIGIDASLFYTYFKNRIIADYLSDPTKIIYDNLKGHAISRGASFQLEYNSQNGLDFNLGLTFMDVFSENNGRKVRQLLTEGVSAVWRASYTLPGLKLKLDYTANLYGPMKLPILGPLDPRSSESPWWSLQNIQLGKEFQNGIKLYGGIKNLLNYTPPSNSIARSFDPFDKNVLFDGSGKIVPSASNPNALSFDPSYVFAPNQGRRLFLGMQYAIYR